ncbi:MAG TPA: DUF5107 domain-containing protein [Chitinispirillaceae bacterium]|nr:DUF5107 domain-containing protein [Chitinispirillaceae bacterium]
MNKTYILLLVMVCAWQENPAAVTLTESQVQWKTFKHTLNPDYSLQNDTFSNEIVTHGYTSLILENEYLKVTLVPEYGGRILSMIYKPTGHEQLYQNPVGRPYGPQWDVFYYDWLMVWGGIFPTFPEPEHGKAWCRPWNYVVTSNTEDKISVKMSFTDSINFKTSATKMKYGQTNITCHFEVTLEKQTSVLKTSVTLVNPNNNAIPYEYWTNVGISPGSVPGAAKCDDQTEIIGPISNVKIYDDWPEIKKAEQQVNGNIYQFKNLRWYKNWANDGIAYAWPVESNFWGALNHANNEAIIRISDNVKTPGLKIWGFGYNQSKGFNPETKNDYHRPFIELWAGVSKEFFTPAQSAAGSTLQFDEYYTPVTGMTSITHASEHAVINLSTDKKNYNGATDKNAIVSCSYFITKPSDRITVNLKFKGNNNIVTVHQDTRTHDTNGPFAINDTTPITNLCNDIDSLIFELRSESNILMKASLPVSFSNAGTCATDVKPDNQNIKYIRNDAHIAFSRKFYAINGSYIGDASDKRFHLKKGVLISVDSRGRCTRFVELKNRLK